MDPIAIYGRLLPKRVGALSEEVTNGWVGNGIKYADTEHKISENRNIDTHHIGVKLRNVDIHGNAHHGQGKSGAEYANF